jgi:hypothetical protein
MLSIEIAPPSPRQRCWATKLAAARFAVIVLWVLFSLVPSTSRGAGAPITLKVEASNGLRGFSRTELSRYLASRMAEANFADWRFEAAEDGPAPDRVEWSFKRNPYAGGEVRRFGREGRSFHVPRPMTLEVRLYLNGQYQFTVEKQAIFDEDSGRTDPHLAEAVASVTQNLLGPSGAYHAVELGQAPVSGAR